jgi:hypothetical protein
MPPPYLLLHVLLACCLVRRLWVVIDTAGRMPVTHRPHGRELPHVLPCASA